MSLVLLLLLLLLLLLQLQVAAGVKCSNQAGCLDDSATAGHHTFNLKPYKGDLLQYMATH
jgi:hypothetical protein